MAVFNVLFALVVVLLLVVGVGWWLLQLLDLLLPRPQRVTETVRLQVTGTVHIETTAAPAPVAEPAAPVGGPYPPGRRIG